MLPSLRVHKQSAFRLCVCFLFLFLDKREFVVCESLVKSVPMDWVGVNCVRYRRAFRSCTTLVLSTGRCTSRRGSVP